MARQPVEGKSPKNKEKKEFQFFNTKTNEWQDCRWYWFIEQRKRGAKTRFRLTGEIKWTNMPPLFEDKRNDNNPAAGPGRQYKYGEPTEQVNVPLSLIPALQKKLERIEKRVAKNKITELQK